MDFSELIQRGAGDAWLYVPVAVMLGALHGLEPGHSKTMMAAFIIAVRGTVTQAALLGLCAAVSHSLVIWVLAALALSYGDHWNVETTEPYFLLVSGVIVVGMAVWTMMRLREEEAHHHRHHGHGHAHSHDDEEFEDAHARAHAEDIRRRFAGRDVTTGQIVLFGITGGLMPCPAAVSILLICLQLKEFTLGFAMVASFSAGLALTMITVGILAAWGMKRLSERSSWLSRSARKAPYVSSALLIVLGLLFVWQGWSSSEAGADCGLANVSAARNKEAVRTPLTACLLLGAVHATAVPTFEVPGQEEEMRTLEAMNALHAVRSPGYAQCTLWDRWMPHAMLWQDEASAKGYRGSLLHKRIDHEGYVSMQQHRGMAHGDGWPFPAWQQSTGKGFHFSTHHEAWAVQIFKLQPLTDASGFAIGGAEVLGIDPEHGLRLKATEEVVTVATPPFRCGTVVAPFARIEWSALGLAADRTPTVSWRYDGEPGWDESRSAPFPPRADLTRTDFAHVPLYRQRGYGGLLAGLRLRFPAAKGAEIRIKSVITAVDTRHPITNASYLEGCADYFAWTGDADFLRQNLARMRQALAWSLKEFQVRELGRVRVSWVGHDGRSGLAPGPDGKTRPRIGLGVGNNYWDLLPFGGDDALATLYQWQAVRRMAEIESWVAARKEDALPAPPAGLGAEDLRKIADDIRDRGGKFFWDEARGRFIGWRDLTGASHDWGFTFLNEEAVSYGFATAPQARAIMDWIDGRRTVEGDTSQGADVFRWRFGPRATTRRNVEDYVWAWSRPDSIPWGGQVQDGGAVFGFSYYDLMARLRTNGPDDAWRRLKEINAWFRETQAEGGYRAYYAKPDRGTMQGGGTAGGLGLDHEFFESALVPTFLVHGFLGLKAGPDGLRAEPRLPKGWPSLTVRGVRFRGENYDVTGRADGTSEIVRR